MSFNKKEMVAGDKIIEYTNDFEDRVESGFKNVSTMNGWTVIEHSADYVEMNKLFYASGINFNAVGNIFGRILRSDELGDLSFPFSLSKVIEISINELPIVGANYVTFWSAGVKYYNQKIEVIRLASDSSSYREVRFSITVKGFK